MKETKLKEQLQGKKLLILGASECEISLVKRAKKLGVYTIVTDYYLDRNISVAKNYADEAWDVSWSELDQLEKLCRKNNVNGVTAGYSEFRVENAIKLCKRLNLPCYINENQLEITRNKILFKETCKKNGVPTINEYLSPEDVNKYPVIIKPVDRGGSIGISIANNRDELLKAYKYAMESSVCKKVIIEDFISEEIGVKFDAYYAICEGKIMLLATDDALHSKKNGLQRVVQSVWLYPSRKENVYRQKIDKKVRNMIKDMGINNGYIFVSGFSIEDDFVFFECGFRLCGGHLYTFLPLMNEGNNMDIFISHALLGNTKNVICEENDKSNLKTLTVNYYLNSGIVTNIKGTEIIQQFDDCNLALINTHLGAICEDDKAILTKAGMFTFSNANPNELGEDLRQCNKEFAIFNKKNEDMIYDRPDHKFVRDWWNK